MIILLYVLNWVLIFLLFLVLVLFVIWMVTGYKAKVPFVPVPNKVLKSIYDALDIKEGSVVYDLGCGDGKVLFFASKLQPKAKYIGIENTTFPLILAHTRSWWTKITKKTEIEIYNQDFFTRDLSDATHIFVYLYPNVMDDLLPKLDRELKPGTRLVSASFKFTTKQPNKTLDLKRSKYKLARTLYVYEF